MSVDSAHIIRAIEKLEARTDQQHQSVLERITGIDRRVTGLYERQANGCTADAKTEAVLRAHIDDCHRHRRIKWRVTLVALGAAATVAGGVVLSLITG
jgi:hypothetical protein